MPRFIQPSQKRVTHEDYWGVIVWPDDEGTNSREWRETADQWCADNCAGKWEREIFVFWFEKQEDALLFRLFV